MPDGPQRLQRRYDHRPARPHPERGGLALSDAPARLRELARRLLALHAALLEGERRAHEQTHGATTRAQLLRLVLDHEDFAWLRALSGLIARIDEALEAEGAAGDAEPFFRETRELLRSGAATRFGVKYREALQRSPEVVMAHADVIRLLPSPPQSCTPPTFTLD